MAAASVVDGGGGGGSSGGGGPPGRRERRPSGGAIACETFGAVTDIKRWFVSVIMPNFGTLEARAACGDFLLTEESGAGFSQAPVSGTPPASSSPLTSPPQSPPAIRLIEANQQMRDTVHEYNPGALHRSRQECFCIRWCSPLQPGSVRSCTVALAATALGAGALAIPYAFSLTGLVLGLVTMTLAAFVSSLSLQILIVAARYSNCQSYAALLELASGKRWASVVLDVAIILNGIGAITCILIFEGDFLPAIFSSPPWFGHGLAVSRRISVGASALAAYPLCLPEKLSALRYVALAVPLVLLTTAAIVWVERPEAINRSAGRGEIKLWDFQLGRWLQATVIMVNAFTNQQNAVPSGNQMDSPSVARIVKATVNANLIIFGLLAALGVGGYLTWGQATKGDFILNYHEGIAGIWACRVMLAVTVYFVLPVALNPATNSFLQIVRLICPGWGRCEGRGTIAAQALYAAAATLLLGACVTIAMITNNVAAVLGILGGLLASSVMFWFPALVFWWMLWPAQPRLFRAPVLVSLVFFGVVGYSSVVVSLGT